MIFFLCVGGVYVAEFIRDSETSGWLQIPLLDLIESKIITSFACPGNLIIHMLCKALDGKEVG